MLVGEVIESHFVGISRSFGVVGRFFFFGGGLSAVYGRADRQETAHQVGFEAVRVEFFRGRHRLVASASAANIIHPVRHGFR